MFPAGYCPRIIRGLSCLGGRDRRRRIGEGRSKEDRPLGGDRWVVLEDSRGSGNVSESESVICCVNGRSGVADGGGLYRRNLDGVCDRLGRSMTWLLLV